MVAAQMREREEGLTPPGTHAISDRSSTPLTAAGAPWEGRQGFTTMSHYRTKRSDGVAAPASGGPLCGGSGRGAEGMTSPGTHVDCAGLPRRWQTAKSQSMVEPGLPFSLASNGPTSRRQADLHGSVEKPLRGRGPKRRKATRPSLLPTGQRLPTPS